MPATDSLSPPKRPSYPDPEVRRVFHSPDPVQLPEEYDALGSREFFLTPPHSLTQPPSKEEPRLPTPRRRVLWFAIPVLILTASYVLCIQGLAAKERVLSHGENGYMHLSSALDQIKAKDYEAAVVSFEAATVSFGAASEIVSFPFDGVLSVTRFVPGLSRIASGKHAIEAGKYFAEAGQPFSVLAAEVSQSKEAYAQGDRVSLVEFMRQAKGPIAQARLSLEKAAAELSRVALDDIPEDKREKFLAVRAGLPTLLGILESFEKNETLLEELLGENGPRIYLFLLQNNQEIRATGGFIGTYALVDVHQGVIRRFFVDGIFNPDGQLRANIVPPKPIQKISAAWSLHDSNWFPDFPKSAEKAISFYEKTGGPTVDGVITVTPTVMQKLLAVVGPIELPQYGIVVDADNFIPVIQEQVEVKYDKELNEPKKVLVDLSRALIERVFALQDRATLGRLAESLTEGLNEKHVLMYMRHGETQKLIDEVSWSGRVLETPKDYLSVIHSNINGYKTDGVIDEIIRHAATVEEDGSIIDTVTITRTHRGGDTPYDWWNRVNADYLRVYVPQGSELISSSGTTWEFPSAPLDYDRLGFKRDADVEREENAMRIDEKTGVRISEDSGKTVFGAWVYVSPKESVTVEYRYRLPFRIDMAALKQGEPASYSILFQKQSGSPGSSVSSAISLPENVAVIWQTEPNLVPYGREWRGEATLRTDVFWGTVFQYNR